MSQAACTVASNACGDKSAVLARPLRCPKYTVMSNDLSCWCSICSISCKRTLTDCPSDSLTSTSAEPAPFCRASAKTDWAVSINCVLVC